MIGRRKAGAKASGSKPKKWRTEIHSSDGSDGESVLNKVDLPPSSDEEDAEPGHRRSRSRSPRGHRKPQADDSEPVVAFSSVSTMPQCIRAVDELVGRIKTASHAELLEACLACKRIGCFDADFFAHIHLIMPSHIRSSKYSLDEVISILDVLKTLNAIHQQVFESVLVFIAINCQTPCDYDSMKD